MKKIISFTIFLLFCLNISSQSKLTIVYASWLFSKKCVERSVENFITMFEMSSSDFKTEMKSLGANITIGENYCIKAAEQLASGADFNSPILVFSKCDNDMIAYWYGPPDAPAVFTNLMNTMTDYYIETQDGIRIYYLEHNNQGYLFKFTRFKNGNQMNESMMIEHYSIQ